MNILCEFVYDDGKSCIFYVTTNIKSGGTSLGQPSSLVGESHCSILTQNLYKCYTNRIFHALKVIQVSLESGLVRHIKFKGCEAMVESS